MNTGRKNDSQKTRLELIAPEALEALGRVLTYGTRKYEPWNWRYGMNWSRPYGALLRHLNAWWSREDNDLESGYSHLWHAFCELMFLVVYEVQGLGHDDRPGHTEAPEVSVESSTHAEDCPAAARRP